MKVNLLLSVKAPTSKSEMNWQPLISINEGIEKVLQNINYWKDAPVWTSAKIKVATKDWFKYLDKKKLY